MYLCSITPQEQATSCLLCGSSTTLYCFFTNNEYASLPGQSVSDLQEIIEKSLIYMIAPSISSPDKQLALIPDQCECLQELDQLFFCGDKPAHNLKEAHN